MSNKRLRSGVVLTLLLLAACGGTSEDAATDNTELLDAARQPLERAESIEGLNLERKQQLDEEIGSTGDE
jgi:hypothetical protein